MRFPPFLHDIIEENKTHRKLELAVCLCIPLRLFLGDDGAVGASVAAGTAVQASGSIDDILVIALADSTGGANVRAGAAAHAGRSDFVSHGKHLHQNCIPIVAYK